MVIFMYFKKQKHSGKIYLYLVDTIFDPYKKRYIQKIVENYGELTNLEKENPELYSRIEDILNDKDKTKILNKLSMIDHLENFKELKKKNYIKKCYKAKLCSLCYKNDMVKCSKT